MSAGMSISASRRTRVIQSVRSVMIMTTKAPSRNNPDTRTVQAAAHSSAAVSQRPARARSQAQNAAAQNNDSVYGTVVNTAVGANSQATAAQVPPNRYSAAAAITE